MWPIVNPPSKTLVSRIILIFDSPAPLTSAIPGNPSIASETISWCSLSTATTKSKSPIVSFLLLALPANCALTTPSSAAIFAWKASPYFKPTSSRLRALNRASSSIPSNIRCWDFLPKPFIGAIRSSSAACFRVATELTPNSTFISLIRFGPRPGIPSISIKPFGVCSCRSFQSLGHRPSPIACVRAEPRPFPIPFISNSRPVATNSPKSSVSPPSILLTFW